MGLPARNFQRKDLNILAAGTSIVFGLAVLVDVLGLSRSMVYAIDILPILLVLATVYYSIQTQGFLGGNIGRNMSLIAIGLAIYGLTFHMINLPYQVLGHPEVLGLTSSFWLATTNALQIFGVSITAYGFYRMWRESQ